ncbi:hypothetical protein L596_003573 [Steinernema carpocapsae]|uniref:Ras-associating domain-containing protein n=2 Tax=Steinernema carpocapsae TaxID=34508 RepID=A0A4U8UUM6_STECR|nr:hypothetical protein L596_003573 [Steinernema carpocapsae]
MQDGALASDSPVAALDSTLRMSQESSASAKRGYGCNLPMRKLFFFVFRKLVLVGLTMTILGDEGESNEGEFNVSVDGVSRYVSGVTKDTRCSEIIYALAHSMNKRGKFVLVIRDYTGKERTLAPNEPAWAAVVYPCEFELREVDDAGATSIEHSDLSVPLDQNKPPPTYDDFIRMSAMRICPVEVDSMAMTFESDCFVSSLNLSRVELEILVHDAIREQKLCMKSLDNSLRNKEQLELLQLQRQHVNLRAALRSVRNENWPQKWNEQLFVIRRLNSEIQDLVNEKRRLRRLANSPDIVLIFMIAP